MTPGKATKIEVPTVAANGCTAADTTDGIKTVDPSTHFPTYPANFAPGSTTYPPVFPPANVSVPPPPVNTINHIVPTMHHISSSTPIRPAPPGPNTPQQFQPYPYPTNASYFAPNTLAPPTTTQRTYYPPQP